MTSSRSKSARRILGILCAGFVMGSGFSQAQEKPRSLVPPLGQPVPAKPDQAPTGTGTASGSPSKQIIEGGRIQGSLVVQTLGGLDAASIGTLMPETGGLGPNMWRGTSPERVVTLLKYLPVSSTSPELQLLFRRLLLTAAIIPQGPEKPTELVRLRLDKLREAGLIEEASRLLNRLPRSNMTPELDRTAVELLLLQGKNEQACEEIEGKTVQTPDYFWTKADVFCNVVAGNMARAEIGVNLLDEQAGGDALFFALFDRLAGGKAEIPESDQVITPLHFAMMNLGGVHMPYPQIEKAGYEFLWALAKQEKADLNDRFMAAYRSLSVGSMGPELSRSLIAQGALATQPEASEDLGRIAALYREATGTSEDLEKARILGDLWTAGEQDGSYLAASKLALPLLLRITPANLGDQFELDALRFLLLAKDTVNAAAWERAVRRGALRGSFEERESARKRIARADAYMLISGAPGIARWNSSNFDAAAFLQGAESGGSENVGLLLSILEVLGEPVPDSLWSAALDLGQVPRSGLSNRVIEKNLEIAAKAGLVGETVALSLAALGEEGPATVSTGTLTAVLSALKLVGLEEDARQLALEAAVMRDL
ncbi:MAG: hypothetical protein K9G33_09285 [Sneathiella sp.]|nr:hypothetical protein [Sneathiella sp.]